LRAGLLGRAVVAGQRQGRAEARIAQSPPAVSATDDRMAAVVGQDKILVQPLGGRRVDRAGRERRLDVGPVAALGQQGRPGGLGGRKVDRASAIRTTP